MWFDDVAGGVGTAAQQDMGYGGFRQTFRDGKRHLAWRQIFQVLLAGLAFLLKSQIVRTFLRREKLFQLFLQDLLSFGAFGLPLIGSGHFNNGGLFDLGVEIGRVAIEHEASDAMRCELQAHVKSVIAPYKYPRALEFVDALPKTQTGKLQRFRLKAGA